MVRCVSTNRQSFHVIYGNCQIHNSGASRKGPNCLFRRSPGTLGLVVLFVNLPSSPNLINRKTKLGNCDTRGIKSQHTGLKMTALFLCPRCVLRFSQSARLHVPACMSVHMVPYTSCGNSWAPVTRQWLQARADNEICARLSLMKHAQRVTARGQLCTILSKNPVVLNGCFIYNSILLTQQTTKLAQRQVK